MKPEQEVEFWKYVTARRHQLVRTAFLPVAFHISRHAELDVHSVVVATDGRPEG
jgi:hypothetical protein